MIFSNTIAKRLKFSLFLPFKKICYSDLIFAPIVMVQSTNPQPLDLILVGNKKSMGPKKVDCRVPVLDIKFRNKSLCPYSDISYDSLKRILYYI